MGKNLLLEEQILFFKSCSILRREIKILELLPQQVCLFTLILFVRGVTSLLALNNDPSHHSNKYTPFYKMQHPWAFDKYGIFHVTGTEDR